ncbi:hypothetical protein [Nocardia asiatica]
MGVLIQSLWVGSAIDNTGADWGGLLATVGALVAPALHGLDRSATAATDRPDATTSGGRHGLPTRVQAR